MIVEAISRLLRAKIPNSRRLETLLRWPCGWQEGHGRDEESSARRTDPGGAGRYEAWLADAQRCGGHAAPPKRQEDEELSPHRLVDNGEYRRDQNFVERLADRLAAD